MIQKKPKIFFLTNNSNSGSTARVVPVWLEGLRARGVDVLMAGPGGALETALKSDGHAFYRMRNPRFSAHDLPRILWHAIRIRTLFGAPQIVHCNEHNVWPQGGLFGRFFHAKTVCHVRFVIERAFGQWAFHRFGRPDALLWTSKFQRNEAASWINEVVPANHQYLLRLGLDVDKFRNDVGLGLGMRRSLGIPDGACVIGSSSPFRPIKRIEDTFEIVRRLREFNKSIYGVCVGGPISGEERYWDFIQSLIRQHNASDWFFTPGEIEDVEAFYNAIDIYVSTSVLETFGNSVVEAMLCGKPIVAYEGGSVVENVGSFGFVFPNGCVDRLVESCQFLISNPQERVKVGCVSRDFALRDFDARDRFGDLLQVYNAVLPSDIFV